MTSPPLTLRPIGVIRSPHLSAAGTPIQPAFAVDIEGEVVVETGPTELARLGPGAFFGEISLVTDLPRSATVRALSDGELFRIDAKTLEVMSARDPALARDVVADLARILSLRLREMTQRLLRIVR